jgi:predicted phage tail protein
VPALLACRGRVIGLRQTQAEDPHELRGRRRHVKVHDRLLGARGAGLIVGFVGLVVVGTLGLAFALQAADVSVAGTVATVVCAIALIVGGPVLMRRLQEMMRRRTGVR